MLFNFGGSAHNQQNYYFGLTMGFPGEWRHLGTFPGLLPTGVSDSLVMGIVAQEGHPYQMVYRGLYDHSKHEYVSWTRIA